MSTRYLNAGEFKPVRLADILVPAYQRDSGERSANAVEKNFDPQLLQAVTLAEISAADREEDDRFLVEEDSYHRTGALYVLVDGLQRCTGLAATHESDATVMAQVFTGVARDRQVDLFVGLNRGSVRVKDYWIYRAKKQSAHPGVLAIDKTIANAGFRVMNGSGGRSKGTDGIPSVGLLTRFCGVSLTAAERDDADETARDADERSLTALSHALSVISALWPLGLDSSAQRTNAGILFGLASLFRDAERANGDTLTVGEVIKKVHDYDPATVITPAMLISESNKLKAKDKEGLVSSGGGNSALKFSVEAWLLVINKGRRSKFRLTKRLNAYPAE